MSAFSVKNARVPRSVFTVQRAALVDDGIPSIISSVVCIERATLLDCIG